MNDIDSDQLIRILSCILIGTLGGLLVFAALVTWAGGR